MAAQDLSSYTVSQRVDGRGETLFRGAGIALFVCGEWHVQSPPADVKTKVLQLQHTEVTLTILLLGHPSTLECESHAGV